MPGRQPGGYRPSENRIKQFDVARDQRRVNRVDGSHYTTDELFELAVYVGCWNGECDRSWYTQRIGYEPTNGQFRKWVAARLVEHCKLFGLTDPT